MVDTSPPHQLSDRTRVRLHDAETLCPVHLCLVSEGIDAARHLASVRHPTTWASCVIVDVG